MTLIQVFLMCYCVSSHLSAPVPHPGTKEADKSRNVMAYLSPTIEKLKNEYAKVFQGWRRGAGPQASGPLRGVHLPVGNNSQEVRASACAVQVYLRVHLPAIIREFFRGAQHRALIGQLEEVANQLSEIPELGVPQNGSRCHLDYQTPPTTYQRKTMGLRILQNVHLWLKSFTED